MCAQVNTADAQVVAGPDEPRLQLESSRVRLHRLFAPVPVCQRGSQAVPQQIVLGGGEGGGLEVQRMSQGERKTYVHCDACCQMLSAYVNAACLCIFWIYSKHSGS